MKLRFFSLLLLLFTFYISLSQDFTSTDLTPFYGKKYYSGPKDCNASVSLTSENNEIIIQFHVKDNVLVFKDKVMDSDHIELWFSMDSLSNDYFVYDNEFYGGDSIVKSKKNDFKEFIISKEEANSQAPAPVVSEIPIVKELNGLVHWAIDLKNEQAVLYDQEYYLKLPVSDSVKQKISVKKEIMPDGYNVTIKIKPEGLIFFRDNVVRELYCMLDVFDIDNTSKDLTALSSSPIHKWGAPETFNKITLKNSLKICKDLNPFNIEFPLAFYFFKNGKWNYFYKQINQSSWFDSYYTYEYKKLTVDTNNYRIKGDTAVAEIYTYIVAPYNNYEDTLRKIKFKKNILGYHTYGCSEGSFSINKIKENEYAIFTRSCYIKNPWGNGECGACIFKEDHYYVLSGGNLNEIINFTYTEDGQRIIIADDYKNADLLKSNWGSQYKSVEIDIKVYEDSEDKIKESCEKYMILWDKNYKTKMEKKRSQCK